MEDMEVAAVLIYKTLCITLINKKVDFTISAGMLCVLEFSLFQNRVNAFGLNLVSLSCFVQKSCVSE